MNRLDALLDDLIACRISRRQLVHGAAALGVAAPALHLLATSNVLALDGNKVRWVSPRGRLEVLDDYPYWVAKQMGYFGDVETDIQGGPADATATVKLVDANQSDMGYPSPGVFSLGLEQGIPIVSVWEMGAYDVFDFAFRKGEGTDDLKTLEGKTVLLGNAGWQAIADPIIHAAGADIKKITYVSAGMPQWGPALEQGQGASSLSWEGLRAQWKAEGLDFDYWLGKEHSKFPANSFVIRRSDFEDESTHETYTKYLRGWAQGLEFGYHNPRAATQITMEVPQLKEALTESFPDLNVAVESMWQLAEVFRGDWAKRQGWGWHDLESWGLYFDTLRQIGQMTKDVKPEDVIFNDFVAGGNDFDHDKVKADAEGFTLSATFEAAATPVGTGA
jgi:NitT/TauT family transport system substrate-binding protein